MSLYFGVKETLYDKGLSEMQIKSSLRSLVLHGDLDEISLSHISGYKVKGSHQKKRSPVMNVSSPFTVFQDEVIGKDFDLNVSLLSSHAESVLSNNQDQESKKLYLDVLSCIAMIGKSSAMMESLGSEIVSGLFEYGNQIAKVSELSILSSKYSDRTTSICEKYETMAAACKDKQKRQEFVHVADKLREISACFSGMSESMNQLIEFSNLSVMRGEDIARREYASTVMNPSGYFEKVAKKVISSVYGENETEKNRKTSNKNVFLKNSDKVRIMQNVAGGRQHTLGSSVKETRRQTASISKLLASASKIVNSISPEAAKRVMKASSEMSRSLSNSQIITPLQSLTR